MSLEIEKIVRNTQVLDETLRHLKEGESKPRLQITVRGMNRITKEEIYASGKIATFPIPISESGEQLAGDPELWQRVGVADMSKIETWQAVADFFGKPYYLTVYAQHDGNEMMKNVPLVVLEGVVAPTPKD